MLLFEFWQCHEKRAKGDGNGANMVIHMESKPLQHRLKQIQTQVLRRIQATQLNIYLDDDADFALLQARIARNAAAKPHRFSEAKPLSLRCGQMLVNKSCNTCDKEL